MSGLYQDYQANPNPSIHIVAVSASGASDIQQFQTNYGIHDLEFWVDLDSNYMQLIPPGGFAFPIEVVIDRTGKVVYLTNHYTKGAALEAAYEAL